MSYQNFTIGPFAGLNQDENPHALRDDELRIADDCARRGNMVGTRPGCVPLGSGEDYENALTSSPVIQGAVEYRNGFDQNRALIVIANNSTATRKIWFNDADRLPAGPTLITDVDVISSFAQHNDLLWGTAGLAGRESSTNNPVWSWDGNTGNAAVSRGLTEKSGGATLRPKFIHSWRGYLLVNGLQGNTDPWDNPSVTRFADFATDPTADVNWADSNTIGFNASRLGLDAYGRTYSTGFSEYQDNNGDFLLLLSNTQIAAVKLDQTGGNDFIVTDAIKPGCVHQRAAVPLGLDSGELVYVSDHGVHSLRQSQEHGGKTDTFISWKIRTFWNTLNRARLPYTCAAYDKRNGRILFAFTTGSETTHDVIMCLDVKDQTQGLTAETARWYGPWHIKSSASALLRINHLEYLRSAAGEWFVYAFSTAGHVLRFTEGVYQDLGSFGYSPMMRTKDFSFGDSLSEKRVGDAMITVAPGGGHNITMKTHFDLGQRSNSNPLRIHGSAGSVVGTGVVGAGKVGSDFVVSEDKVYLTGGGREVGFEFTHSSAAQGFFIGNLSVQIAGAGESTGDV